MNKVPNILIVDDDVSTIEILTLILQNSGYEVMFDKYGDLAFLQTGIYPDLILLDYQLGQKNGSSLCIELKHDCKTRHIPIILLSGIEDLELIAKEACADDFLPKPFNMKNILTKVETLLLEKALVC